MLLALIIFAHLSISDCTKAPNSSGFIATGSAPSFSQATFTSGRTRILLISEFSRLTIGCGVPVGAITPSQIVAWCGIPDSVKVGTLGSEGDRTLPVVPNALTRPASIICAIVGTESNIMSTWPLTISLRAWVLPL